MSITFNPLIRLLKPLGFKDYNKLQMDAKTVELITDWQRRQHGVINQAKDKTQKMAGQDWRVRLSRYAAQQLYAPERLLKGDSAIERIPVASQAIPLIRGGVIEATPIASWQGGGLTVTAVRLQNKQTHPLILQFTPSGEGNSVNLNKLLRGRWLTATLQHKWLGALGQKDDTTTLYLVSAQSFVESTGFVNLNAGLEEDNADG